jgi:hypothetical protein
MKVGVFKEQDVTTCPSCSNVFGYVDVSQYGELVWI